MVVKKKKKLTLLNLIEHIVLDRVDWQKRFMSLTWFGLSCHCFMVWSRLFDVIFVDLLLCAAC